MDPTVNENKEAKASLFCVWEYTAENQKRKFKKLLHSGIFYAIIFSVIGV